MFEALGNLGDFVGGVAVIVTLVYLAGQVRQNTRTSKATASALTSEGFTAWWGAIAQSDEVASVFLRGLADEDLSPTEQLRFTALLTTLFGYLQNSFYQHELGVLPFDPLELGRRNVVEGLFRSPAVRRWWERDSHQVYSPEFRARIGQIAERVATGGSPAA